MRYFRIDVIDIYDEGNGCSMAVKWEDDSDLEADVLRYCIEHFVEENDDDFNYNIEDITNNEYEMRFWKNEAVEVKASDK